MARFFIVCAAGLVALCACDQRCDKRLSAYELPGEYVLPSTGPAQDELTSAVLDVTEDEVTLTYRRVDGSEYVATYRVVATDEQ